MKRLVFLIFVSSMVLGIAFVQKGIIPTVSASFHHGDLVLTDNNVYIIENERYDINGSIIVEENATLILRNVIINFTDSFDRGILMRNPAHGNPRLQAENTTVMSSGFSDNCFSGNSSITLSNCTMSGFVMYGEANATITNSTIYFIQAREGSAVSLLNSTLGDLDIVSHSANISIVNLSPSFFAFWDFRQNCSVTSSSFGMAPYVRLIETAVERWRFSFQPSCVEIVNSEIYWLHANGDSCISISNSTARTIELYVSSIAESTNSTHLIHYLNDDAKLYVNWYLSIHVTDSIHQNVPSANVTATYPNATVAKSKLTDANGLARLTLMEKMINATGEYPIGNYDVDIAYETHSNNTEVSMTGNKELTLALDFIVPEFPSFLNLPVLMIATLLAAILYRTKRNRPNT